MLDSCTPETVFKLADPDAPTEIELEACAVRAFACIYPRYKCVVFGGDFEYEGRISRPDLALVARDHSHWFIVEVELLTHSLEGHVIPQVTAFQYGEPQANCAPILARELGIHVAEAEMIVDRVPRSVVVLANDFDPDWHVSLRALRTQFLSLSRFTTPSGEEAFELFGTIQVVRESIGFGTYSAIDGTIRFARDVRLTDGLVQIEGVRGSSATWRVVRDSGSAWVTKELGKPDLPDAGLIQLVRTFDGRISLKLKGER